MMQVNGSQPTSARPLMFCDKGRRVWHNAARMPAVRLGRAGYL
jgi:hypothetical protein